MIFFEVDETYFKDKAQIQASSCYQCWNIKNQGIELSGLRDGLYQFEKKFSFRFLRSGSK
jgi:hypothetical protein